MSRYPELDDPQDDEAHLERCRRYFEETGNPLYAWEAWGACRPGNSRTGKRRQARPFPDWLLTYLDSCDERLIGLPEVIVSREPGIRVHGSGIQPTIDRVVERPAVEAVPGEGAGPVGRALGFDEGLAKAREHWGGPHDHNERLALRVAEQMWANGLTLERAAEVVNVEDRIDPQRTKRAFKAADKFALTYMRHRVIEATGDAPLTVAEIIKSFRSQCRQRAK